jgi:hypothetical protein
MIFQANPQPLLSGNKLNKNSKISKKNIAVISTLGIFLLIGFIGIPELTRNLLFYPDAPTALHK